MKSPSIQYGIDEAREHVEQFIVSALEAKSAGAKSGDRSFVSYGLGFTKGKFIIQNNYHRYPGSSGYAGSGTLDYSLYPIPVTV